MFTGIVEATGSVREIGPSRAGLRLTIDLGPLARDVAPGDSIAVAGCCLTAAALEGPACSFDVVPETLSKTTLRSLSAGCQVNLERALRLGDRLGGHLVTGHVDGTGVVRDQRAGDAAVELEVGVDEALETYLLPKGSIAVDGVSLTVAAVVPGGFRVALVPHTLERTTLAALRAGHRVNLESDLLGKWVERLLIAGRLEAGSPLLEAAARRVAGASLRSRDGRAGDPA